MKTILPICETVKIRHIYVYDKARKRIVGEYDLSESGSPPIEATVQVATYVRVTGATLKDLTYLVTDEDLDYNFTELCKRALSAMLYNINSVHLTPRENEVLGGIVSGKQNKEIAADLHLSERTVKFHVSSLLAKHNCNGRITLAAIVSQAFFNQNKKGESNEGHFQSLPTEKPIISHSASDDSHRVNDRC